MKPESDGGQAVLPPAEPTESGGDTGRSLRLRGPAGPLTLAVVSHVTHYRHQGRLWAFGPYSREIDIWADLFDRVVIVAPGQAGQPPADSLPFQRSNIDLAPLPETGGTTLGAKLRQAVRVPQLTWGIAAALLRTDVAHVRCPGNVGLIGAVLAPLLSRRPIAKYAGQWNGYGREPWSIRLQRALLKSFWWRNGLVTVYGEWPDQPRQVVPFFTSMMTASQVRRAVDVAARKQLGSPAHILFSGRLARTKRVDLLLDAAARLAAEGIPFRLTVIGDGPERASLEGQVGSLGLQERVRFVGAVPYEEMLAWYEQGQILVLPSAHSEGWPKVIAEGMCHGLVCIGTNHGFVPRMLGGRGHIVPVNDVSALTAALRCAITDPEQYQRLSRAASSWGRERSLEGLRDSLRALMAKTWFEGCV